MGREACPTPSKPTTKLYQIIELKAEEMGVTITAEQEEQMTQELESMVEQSGGEEEFQVRLDALCITKDSFAALNRIYFLNEGIRKKLEESGADLCYVTPSHHFPTGVTMPAGRRAQLLRWAAAREGRYILEDDYDAEFRFDMRPLPSLQGMGGGGGRVVYLCTFSKSLAPSIRIACMVLPWELLGEYRRAFGSYSNTVSRFEQQTLRLFLEGGYFTRHLARMRGAYKGRMERLAAALEERFEAVRLSGRHTGLHLLLQLPEGPGEEAMIRRALEEGVRLKGLSEYYMERRERCGDNCVILGYASLRDGEIGALAEALGRAWGRE